MKELIASVILLFTAAASASAQNPNEQSTIQGSQGLGYVFAGAATHGMGLAGGFGGEISGPPGLGMGLEVGAVGLTRSGDQYYNSYTTGVGSADVLYHYFPKRTKGPTVSPFIAGGYTMLFGHNSDPGGKDVKTNGFNLGGGVDLFATKHAGVRFDVRYYGHGGRILQNAYPELAEFSFVAFRIGLTFR